MNTRRIVGIILLIAGLVWFMFAPATSITSPPGVQVIFLENIIPGILLLIIGIIMLLPRRGNKPA